MGITKKEYAELVDKAVDLYHDDDIKTKVQARLFDFAFGMFTGKDITFEEVYMAIKRIMLTVEAVMEEM